MTSFSLAAAAERFGGTILNPDVMFNAISIDSRSINAGDLFFAIQGPTYDGHAFIPEIENKICGAVVNNCLLYTSPSPRDKSSSRMPSSA